MKLHSKILIGLFTGIALGLMCNLLIYDKDLIKWIVNYISYPVGQIFLRMIFMIVVPLIFVAIVLGVADFRDINKIGRIGGKVILFTIVITTVSVLIGIILVNLIEPGKQIAEADKISLINAITGSESVTGIVKTAKESKDFIQIIIDIIPRNPFAEVVYAFDPNYRGGGLLSLMFFALVFGVAMSLVKPERTEVLTKSLQGVYDILMKIIDFAMKLAPFGVAALIFTTTSQLGFQAISLLISYVSIVLVALFIHFIVTYSVILKYLVKTNPVIFYKKISEVIVTAFSTSSSNATLPTSIRVTNEKFKLDKDITNFVLTVGSTANQNGTALYEGITVLFLAQFYGIDLSLSSQFVIILLSILAGVG
ncbi:MAG: dicarboxylate/amino acid:cation symporter, partial [Ignavibacteriales bacterium]